jgi:hypothetical protein
MEEIENSGQCYLNGTAILAAGIKIRFQLRMTSRNKAVNLPDTDFSP